MATHNPARETPGLMVGDDFTHIRGIGPGIASRLHGAGILRYTQLAGLSPEEIVAACGGLIGLTVERVAQQDWAGQAQELSRAANDALTDDRGGHLHYETYTVELLLDEQNLVRRTRLVDVRAGMEEAWAGWDAERLAQFMVAQSGLREAAALEATPPQPELPPLTGQVEIRQLAALQPATGMEKQILQSRQPFALRLSLDLSQVQLSDAALRCHTVIQGKELASGERLVLAEWDAEQPAAPAIELAQEHPGLPAGMYRLEAAAMLRPAGAEDTPQQQLATFIEGQLLQII